MGNYENPKFQIISDEIGQFAKLYIDGEEVKDVTAVSVTSNRHEFGLRLKFTRYKRDKNGEYKLCKHRTEILTEMVTYNFPIEPEVLSLLQNDDFSKYMNEPKD